MPAVSAAAANYVATEFPSGGSPTIGELRGVLPHEDEAPGAMRLAPGAHVLFMLPVLARGGGEGVVGMDRSW